MREFAEREIAPHVMEWDEARVPARTIKKLGKLGYMGPSSPRSTAAPASATSSTPSSSRNSRAWTARWASSSPRTLRSARNHIFMAGNDEQQQRYIPKLATGEWIGCWSLTEPEAGLRCRRHPHHRRAQRRRLGAERRQDLHHQRALCRCLRRHGGHRPGRGAARHLGLHRREGHARVSRSARRKTSSACAPAPPAK